MKRHLDEQEITISDELTAKAVKVGTRIGREMASAQYRKGNFVLAVMAVTFFSFYQVEKKRCAELKVAAQKSYDHGVVDGRRQQI